MIKILEQLGEIMNGGVNNVFPINDNDSYIGVQRNIKLDEINETLKSILVELKRSNDTVDELNRLSEEDSQQIGLEFGDDDAS